MKTVNPRGLLPGLAGFVGEAASGALSLLYPPRCLACDQESSDAAERPGLCEECRREMFAKVEQPACRRCAATVGRFLDDAPDCPWCRGESFAFERVLRLASYDGALAAACRAAKEPARHALLDLLCDELCRVRGDAIRAERIDFVVPVPLHWTRRVSRGHDQAAHMARRVGHRLKTSVRTGWLRRQRATPHQTRLSPTERRKSVRRAFKATFRCSVRGRCVLLVDDVMTTGSTAHQAAAALRQAGAAKVVVAVLARGDAHGRFA